MTAPLWDDNLEAAVLGAALTHPNAARQVVARCAAADFHLLRNRRVFDYVARMLVAEERPDCVVVAMAAERADRPHILGLPERCPVVVNAGLYADRLHRLTALRRLGLALDRATAVVGAGLPAQLRDELVAAATDPNVLDDAGGSA